MSASLPPHVVQLQCQFRNAIMTGSFWCALAATVVVGLTFVKPPLALAVLLGLGAFAALTAGVQAFNSGLQLHEKYQVAKAEIDWLKYEQDQAELNQIMREEF